MLLSENLSPIFSHKSKSSGNSANIDSLQTNSKHDIIEHDVTTLHDLSCLPSPTAFDALQISSER